MLILQTRLSTTMKREPLLVLRQKAQQRHAVATQVSSRPPLLQQQTLVLALTALPHSSGHTNLLTTYGILGLQAGWVWPRWLVRLVDRRLVLRPHPRVGACPL